MQLYTLEEAEIKLKQIKRKKIKDLINTLFLKNRWIGIILIIVGIISAIVFSENGTSSFILICLGLAVFTSKDYHFRTGVKDKERFNKGTRQ